MNPATFLNALQTYREKNPVPGTTSTPQAPLSISSVTGNTSLAYDPNAESYRFGGVIYNAAGDPIGQATDVLGDATLNYQAPAAGYNAPAADPQAVQDAKDAAERTTLREDIKGRGTDIMAVYEQLFGGISNVAKSRAGEVDKSYGEQRTAAAKALADAMPAIETSYASIGSGDSTDNTYAKKGAKDGFDATNKTIQKNQDADLAKIGNYVSETGAKWNADKESLTRLTGRVDTTNDLGELRGARNSTEDKLSTLRAEAGTLNTDVGARKVLTDMTSDAGRKDSVLGSLDEIIKSSMSGAVKGAAVTAVLNSSGLSEADKQLVQQQYGNVYADQATK